MNMSKIFYIWDYWLNRLPEPAPMAEAKIIPFPGKPLDPLEEWMQMEDMILLGYRSVYPSIKKRLYLAYYLPETGPRFISTYYFHEDGMTGEIEVVSWGRFRGRFVPDEDIYTCTDAVHLAPPNPDRRQEYLNSKAEKQDVRRLAK
jgi:hypothetical protein